VVGANIVNAVQYSRIAVSRSHGCNTEYCQKNEYTARILEQAEMIEQVGLVSNAVENNFRDVTQYGGNELLSPRMYVPAQCGHNCDQDRK
jgi:hypothetical protein